MPLNVGNIGIYSNTLPSLPESANGLRLKIDRANKHIHDLHALLESFYAKNPYGIRLKKDAQTGEDVVWIEKIGRTPDDVSVIAADALQNLRSTLDYLAFKLYAIKNPGKPDDIVYFPIAKSEATYKSSGFRGKVKCFGIAIEKRIDKIKPYKGGNDFLWRLHELNKIDKHRLLISAASGFQMRSILARDKARLIASKPHVDPGFWEIVKWTASGGPTGRPLNIGDELYRGRGLTFEEKKNMQFKIQIAFNEPGIGESEPIVDSLYHFSKVVENICRSFADLL